MIADTWRTVTALLLLAGAVDAAYGTRAFAAAAQDGYVDRNEVARLNGRVLDAESGSGVRGAIVQLVGGGAERTAYSDDDGAYGFADIAPDDYVVSVLHPGYEGTRLRIALRPSSHMTIDFPLAPRPVRMPALLVRAATLAGVTAVHARADSSDLRSDLTRLGGIGRHSAGALGDFVLTEIARESPRDESGGRRPHVLYVWGSSTERGRVVLDGATVNAPLQLGGILPPLDPEALGRADLRTAGTSSRYDGGTSYIMDFRTRPASGETARLRTQVDLLASSAMAEAPIGDAAGLLVAARRVNDELMETVLDRRFGYGYADVLARGEARGAGGRVAATAVATRESIRLPRDVGEDRAGWENFAAVLSWHGSGTNEDRLVTASCSRGVVDVPVLSAPGGHLRATADRCAVAAEQQWNGPTVSVLAGLDLEHLRFARHTSAHADPGSPDVAGSVSCTPSLPCTRASATTLAPYADVGVQLGRGVSLRAGLRAGYQPSTTRLSALPRFSISRVDPRGRTSVTFAAGRFSQIGTIDSVAGPSTLEGNGSEGAAAAGPVTRTAVAHATQVELNVEHRATYGTFAATALLHRYEGDGAVAPFTAPGADLSWSYARGTWRFAAGYSVLARRRSLTGSSSETQHLAGAALAAAAGRLDLSLSTAYGRGIPLTAVVLETPEVTGPFPTGPHDLPDRSYFRIDATLSAEWTIDRVARSVRITPYARVVNGLSRRDALFYFDDDSSAAEPRPLAALPALPVLGLRIAF